LDQSVTGSLVLITGTGRSGTSTMSGALHHLGLFVPGPYLGANESNPKGFFESSWAVRFHKQIARAAGINDFDSNPNAFSRVQAALTQEHRASLCDFVRKQAAVSDQVVVKDPRSVWVQALWRDAAEAAGLRIKYLSMLRHPAEVVGSRTTYYANTSDERQRRRYETFSVARWVNSSLVNELQTRGQPRAFVSYVDLLADWRATVRRVGQELRLHYPQGPRDAQEQHALDDFVDPGLRRHTVTWDELDVPLPLRDLAQDVWDAVVPLARPGAVDTDSSAALDELAPAYQRLFEQSADIAHDATEEARYEARRAGAREARREAPQSRVAPNDSGLREIPARELLVELRRRLVSRAHQVLNRS
jgi:hypothetical protein